MEDPAKVRFYAACGGLKLIFVPETIRRLLLILP